MEEFAMRIARSSCLTALLLVAACAPALAQSGSPALSVSPQYDTTHVYVAPDDFNRFVKSLSATFGGTTSPEGEFQVTPTPSKTMSQLVLTPVGSISVFGFKTPIPYPFGAERTGYLVTDMDAAIASAKAHGADVLVTPFNDPVGRDAVIQWAGGVNMQLYWHTTKPNYAALTTVPENRVYVSPERADGFVRDFIAFSQGKVISDDKDAPGIEIGRPNEKYRRIRLESGFGKVVVLVTDGHLPFPYGREMTGYDVVDMAPVLHKAIEAGVIVLIHPYRAGDRDIAFVQFPGGYIAELHAPAHP
jgi:hypothetical protein